MEQVTKLIKEEELRLTKGSNDSTIPGKGNNHYDYTISGNWISVEIFRQKFLQFMITELHNHGTEDFPTLYSSTGETTESSVDPKTEAAEDVPPDGVSSAKGSSLNPDVLALMQKTGACQNSALLCDLQTATINVNCDDPTEKERIEEEFYTAYQELMMGGKLKEHAFPMDNVQQANAIVDEYTKMFSHTYFRYDPEKKEIKCLSTDAQQMQNVRRWLSTLKKKNTDNKSISKHKFSIKSVNDGDIKGDKHSEDTPIDSFKEPDYGENKNKTVSNKNVATDEDGENKEKTAKNENRVNKGETKLVSMNKSSGYDSSVDSVSTIPDLKPVTNNTNPSLQSALTDPLNLVDQLFR